MDQLLPGQIVVLLAAFVFGMCTVEPHFRHGAVLGQEFEQLVQEVFVVIVHFELESPGIIERTSLDRTRDGAQGGCTAVAVQTVRRLHLVEVGR